MPDAFPDEVAVSDVPVVTQDDDFPHVEGLSVTRV